MNVLIVEDDKGFATALDALFESVSEAVTFARSWLEARRIILSEPCFDVIALDVFLRDDVQVLPQIRWIKERCEATVIVVISGMDDPIKLKQEAEAAGADAVLHKDELRANTLLASLARAFEKKKASVKSIDDQLKVHLAATKSALSALTKT